MRRARRAAAGILVGVALAASVRPAAAVEPIAGVPLPDEPPVALLDELVTDAVGFDLDGDGVRELLALGSRDDAPGLIGLRAWWVAEDGTVSASNQVEVRRSASGDEQESGGERMGIDANDTIAVGLDEPARLVEVDRDGRDILLVVTLGTGALGGAVMEIPCCFTAWEVTLTGPDAIGLRQVADTERTVAEVVPADLDADGTDELFVTEGPPGGASEGTAATVLRWVGDRYEGVRFTMPDLPGCCFEIFEAGETDGRPGEEVVLAPPISIFIEPTGGSSRPPVAGPEIVRVSLRQGRPHVEGASLGLDAGESADVRAVGLEAGAALLVSDGLRNLYLHRWPADGVPELIASWAVGAQRLEVFGSGDATRVFMITGHPPAALRVLPGDLGGGEGPLVFFRADERLRLGAPVPFYGVLPGGAPPSGDAVVFSGIRVTATADPEALAEATPMALLPGLQPMGFVGEGGRWAALLDNFGQDLFFGSGFFGSVESPRPASTGIQLDVTRAAAALTLVATASLLEAEIDGGQLAPTFTGVAPDPERPGDLIVGNDAVDAEIVAPPGSSVTWAVQGQPVGTEVPVDGVARIRLLEPARPGADDGTGATVAIEVRTPSGHAYSGTWRITIYRQPPGLGVEDEAPLVEFSPTLSGRTRPGSQLTINGSPIQVAADGTFSAPIAVGIVPTELRLVVVDSVGNRTERVVTRVWPLDYRQLPFIPIAVLLTVSTAVVLYLRRPAARPSRPRPDGDATFEEIDG